MGRAAAGLYLAGLLFGGLSGGICIPLFTSSAGWICGGILGTSATGGLSGGWLGCSLADMWAAAEDKAQSIVCCLWLFFVAFVIFGIVLIAKQQTAGL